MRASSVRPTARRSPRSRTRLVALAVGAVVATSVAACTGTGAGAAPSAPAAGDAQGSAAGSGSGSALLDSSTVHTISVEVDPQTYQSMIDTFVESGRKEWISATVTIDGTVFTDVGIKLKGNSSLMGLRGPNAGFPGAAGGPPGGDAAPSGSSAPSTTADPATGDPTTPAVPTTATPEAGTGPGPAGAGPGATVSADEPAGLPWRIRLDKFVDGQNYQGETDIVVRANNSETSLNEAVALELIGAAGMPTQEAAAVRFSVNGSDQHLRLVLETPDDDWYAETVGVSGILYKAEAGGDYSYRGEDPAAYTDVFEIEANTSSRADDYAPLIAFLKWLNESDDAAFAAELGRWLDVDSFADYLAIQDLVANTDDIDGPGNNSYLSYDEATGLFTVISWDQNLAFGGLGAGMGGNRPGQLPDGVTLPDGVDPSAGFGPPSGVDVPDGMPMPEGMPPGGGPGGGGGMGGGMGGNVLSQKFTGNEQFAALVSQASTELKAELYGSGTATQILNTWTATLHAQATDLVSTETIATESAAIADFFTR